MSQYKAMPSSKKGTAAKGVTGKKVKPKTTPKMSQKMNHRNNNC